MFVISRSSGALVPVSITAARDFCHAKGATTPASAKTRGFESAIATARTIVTTVDERNFALRSDPDFHRAVYNSTRYTRYTSAEIVGNFWTQVDTVGR